MSVVIVGGNECMARRYEELCESYACSAKIYLKTERGMMNIGTPDLLVLFTSTMSHKMVKSALSETKGLGTVIARCHSSSMTALKGILDTHSSGGNVCLSK